LHLLITHADRRAPSRALGFADTGRIVKDEIGRGILLLGDLNEYPDAPGVRSLIDAGLVDVSAGISDTVSVGRVDYVLADPPLARIASPARVWTTDKSDHHAVLVDLAW
jgi:endonuclease/exonuclease/phosphatase family metal-dependent hydrolase